ncbi:hypothetical protein D3C75_1025950 [compost metagenome]
MFSPGVCGLIDIGGKAQDLSLTLTFHVHGNRHERRIVDLDADFLDRGDEEIIIAVAADDGGEQLDHRLAPDRRAQVVPGTVTGDTHVDIATEVRVPQMHRWQPLFGLGNLRQQIYGLAGIGHHPLLNDSCPKGYERNPQAVALANLPACCRETSAIRHGC